MALVKTRTSLIEVVTTQIRSHEHKDLNFTWQQGVLPYGEIIPQSNIYCYTIVQPNSSTQENLPITCTKKFVPRSTSNREVVQSKERPCNSCETKDCCPLRPRQLLARPNNSAERWTWYLVHQTSNNVLSYLNWQNRVGITHHSRTPDTRTSQTWKPMRPANLLSSILLSMAASTELICRKRREILYHHSSSVCV